MSRRRKIVRVLRTVWIAAGVGSVVWIFVGFNAAGVGEETLRSDATVSVSPGPHGITFRPARAAAASGLIFLPGGMVESVAYAPLLRRVASAGHPAHLLDLPLRCACTDGQIAQLFQRIREIVKAEPGVAWSLAGHSRGAMLATRYLRDHETGVAGLALIGTTHPRDFDLSHLKMPVAKIYGTRDGIASYDAMMKNKRLLPESTKWIAIEGGNHVQFGYYRHQFGDDAATISREEQQALLLAALLKGLA